MRCPRPSEGSLSPTAPEHDLSQGLIVLSKRSVQDCGLLDAPPPQILGLTEVLVICSLRGRLAFHAWRTSVPCRPQGGARGKALAGHSASKLFLAPDSSPGPQSWPIVKGAS